MTDHIRENLKEVESRIAEAALRSGRQPEDVTLVAICKTFPAEAVAEAYAAGVRDFGENRVNEAQRKIPEVDALISGTRPTWHMVGHIQSRKARDVVACFDVVHSVDRLKVADRLSSAAVDVGRVVPVLLECNVSGESSKFGFDVWEWEHDEDRRARFFTTVADLLNLPGIDVKGLMTMAPLGSDSEVVRSVFASLRRLVHALREQFVAEEWLELSMGMTNDFEVAVEEGSTMVRIGRAIFGTPSQT